MRNLELDHLYGGQTVTGRIRRKGAVLPVSVEARFQETVVIQPSQTSVATAQRLNWRCQESSYLQPSSLYTRCLVATQCVGEDAHSIKVTHHLLGHDPVPVRDYVNARIVGIDAPVSFIEDRSEREHIM